MKRQQIILCYLLFFAGCDCNKSGSNPVDVLPPITQTGANTFGCKINGHVWVPHFRCASFANPCGELRYTITPVNSINDLPIFFALIAGNDKQTQSSITITPRWIYSFITGIGNFADSLEINYSGSNYSQYPSDGIYSKYNFLGSRVLNNDFTIAKLDTINKIVSGVATQEEKFEISSVV